MFFIYKFFIDNFYYFFHTPPFFCAITSLGTKNIKHPYLTTKGYEYLTENTMMKKAYKFLKEIKGWIPTMN
ncbi:YjcQ family protein [Fusobacterium animalis]|uniref:YjcQ family protein n=1 Tax=Fusobacterium animalis TaxID=76859 RepID=UPI0030CB0DB8